jgi:hypothetical protein
MLAVGNGTESSSRKKDVLEAPGQFDSAPDAFFSAIWKVPNLRSAVGRIRELEN